MPKYSPTLMDHFLSPRNSGRLESPDLVGREGQPDKAPFMVLHLRLDDDVVVEAKFQTFGCGPAIAAGSVFTEMIAGRTIEECCAMDAGAVVAALGGMPADKRWCARLPIGAFQDALDQFRRHRSPKPSEPC